MMIYFLLPVPSPDKIGGGNHFSNRPVFKVNLATLAKIWNLQMHKICTKAFYWWKHVSLIIIGAKKTYLCGCSIDPFRKGLETSNLGKSNLGPFLGPKFNKKSCHYRYTADTNTKFGMRLPEGLMMNFRRGARGNLKYIYGKRAFFEHN